MVIKSFAGAKELFIMDYLGRIVEHKILSSQFSVINIQSLNKGIYIVKMITTNGEVNNKKLIIE